jgi:hypothetical protein
MADAVLFFMRTTMKNHVFRPTMTATHALFAREITVLSVNFPVAGLCPQLNPGVAPGYVDAVEYRPPGFPFERAFMAFFMAPDQVGMRSRQIPRQIDS